MSAELVHSYKLEPGAYALRALKRQWSGGACEFYLVSVPTLLSANRKAGLWPSLWPVSLAVTCSSQPLNQLPTPPPLPPDQ